MKKLLCALLILCLMFCAVALAEGEYNENDSTATTTLTTTIKEPDAPTYTVIIPSTLAIEPNATSTALSIQLEEVANASEISITTANSGSMTNGSDGTIDFTVTSNELSFSNFNTLPSTKTMTINITSAEWQQAPAGDYTGTMSFTISAQ